MTVLLYLHALPLCADESLYDNGPPNYQTGYSNVVDWQGARRTLLDDFVVPENQEWIIDGFRHLAIWNTMKPGAGTDFELFVRKDDNGEPGELMLTAMTVAYSEEGTGRIVFGRPEYQSWYQFEPFELCPGRYWIEGTAVGPLNENNFWLITGYPIFTYSECWVDYEDVGGLQSGSHLFGQPTDLNFRLLGSIVCAADFDGDEEVDFADLLALLSAWGPCPHQSGCPEDLDDDGDVGLSDLLILLAAWGPCE